MTAVSHNRLRFQISRAWTPWSPKLRRKPISRPLLQLPKNRLLSPLLIQFRHLLLQLHRPHRLATTPRCRSALLGSTLLNLKASRLSRPCASQQPQPLQPALHKPRQLRPVVRVRSEFPAAARAPAPLLPHQAQAPLRRRFGCRQLQPLLQEAHRVSFPMLSCRLCPKRLNLLRAQLLFVNSAA